jgi:monoamine oxidase
MDYSDIIGQINRRQFLRRLGIATGATLTSSVFSNLHALTPPDEQLRVVILGAGLAGLCAAYELEQRGHTCVILEAESSHIGGRVRTLRFEDGLYGEAGAMRIPAQHTLTRQYIKQFGLHLRKFINSNPEAYYYLRGKRARMKDVKQLYPLYDLTTVEREKLPDDMWANAHTRKLESLSERERADFFSPVISTEGFRSVDRKSLLQLFQEDGLSADAIDLLISTFGYDVLTTAEAATESLAEELKHLWTQEFDEIVGGSARLPTAFADRLKAKPRLGCEVVRIEYDPLGKQAAAVYRERGKEHRVEGDFILCTLPFPVLNRIEVNPLFSAQKQKAIRELHYDTATKVLVVSARRFWETDDRIYGGATFSDLPTVGTYYPSDNAEAMDPQVSARSSVFLASYSWGQPARQLAILPHRARAQVVLNSLGRIHPQLGQENMVKRTASWCWSTHPWSGGGYAWFMPGQHTTLQQHIIKPEGRVHFAGEHCSLNHAWMQGALESALHAVKEMLIASRE